MSRPDELEAITESAGFSKTSGFIADTRAFCSIPARHDMSRRLDAGYVASEWGTSENNRRAKYYRLTALGKKQLQLETDSWQRFAEAVSLVLRYA